MKSFEDGSGLSFPNKFLCTSGVRSNPRPRSSRVASPSQVYCHMGQTCDFRGVMHLNRKSEHTIIDDRS
jgi:hypothetical protein